MSTDRINYQAIEMLAYTAGKKIEQTFPAYYVDRCSVIGNEDKMLLLLYLSDEFGTEFIQRIKYCFETDEVSIDATSTHEKPTDKQYKVAVSIMFDVARMFSDTEVFPYSVDRVDFAPCRVCKFKGVQKNEFGQVTAVFTCIGRPLKD